MPKLYVENLGQDFETKDTLKGLFMPYGTIIDAKLLKDKTGKSFGFGTVTFSSTSMAHKAWRALNGLKVGSGQRIAVWKDRLRCENALTMILIIACTTVSLDFLSFSESSKECYVCFESLTDDKTFDMGCDHRMCAFCARKYFVELISECQTERCKCPHPSCDRSMADKRLIDYFVDVFNKRGKLVDNVIRKSDNSDTPVSH